MSTIVVIVILAAWLLVSIVSQFDAVPWIKQRDVFSLIPRWSFFAPRPGTFDYHLLYRDFLAENQYSQWQEIPLADERSLHGAIWNPDKRGKKALSDTVRSLTRLQQTSRPAALPLSIPYLTALNYVSAQRHEAGATATQFMIVRTDGFVDEGQPRLIFRSELHRL